MRFTEEQLIQAVIELFETDELGTALSGSAAGYELEVEL